MKKFVKIALTWAFLTPACLAEPALEYTALTDLGWEVHLYDFKSQESKRLTTSAGDKRVPRYVSAWDAIAYRDSRGRINYVDSKGEEKVWAEVEGCADFIIQDQGEENPPKAFVTRLVTGNPQRQLIWRLTLPDVLHPAARAPKGSLRQLTLRPEGGFFATHLWRRGEERIIEFQSSLEDTQDGEVVYWTSEKEVAAYPLYIPNKGLLYSYKTSPLNYDLVLKKSAESSPQVIVASAEWSEQASALDAEGETLFFERSNKQGEWFLAQVSLKEGEEGEVKVLELPHQAKEPRWADVPSEWFGR